MNYRLKLVGLRLVVLVLMLGTNHAAFCQTSAATAPSAGHFSLLSPGTLDLIVFGGGFVSADYGTTQQGVEVEQSVTRTISLVARMTGYQLYINGNFANPLQPSGHPRPRYNFARLQGGFDIEMFDGTHLVLLGGGDVGDSNAGSFEDDFSTWLLRKSSHPVNLSVSTSYSTQNKVVSNEVDLRAIIHSTDSYTVLGGAGGALYAGGFVHGIDGQGGPIVGLYFPKWQMGFDIQSGYGTAGEYGEIAIYKQFRWME
jgi:hypothetical protein